MWRVLRARTKQRLRDVSDNVALPNLYAPAKVTLPSIWDAVIGTARLGVN
ncbi:MAG: hypothetical protein ACR2ND_02450 [Solirubrobacteraceae bacterium]